MLIRLLFLVSLLIPTQCFSSIISLDDPVFGINSVTRDTNSSLEWLDVTLSVNRSYNDVSTQFSIGGDFEGWRYATITEFDSLMAFNFGLNNGEINRSTSYIAENIPLQELFGLTYFNPSNAIGEAERFISGTLFTDSATQFVNFATFNSEYKLPSNLNTMFWVSGINSNTINYSGSQWGNWLVRSSFVPEPSTYLLLLSGLISLVFTRHKLNKNE